MDIPDIEFTLNKSQINNIEIIDLEKLSTRKSNLAHDPEKPHRVNFYMLISILEGKGKHFIDFSRYSFKNGSFIFVNKNQIHAFDLKNHPRGKAILFTDDFIDGLQINTRAPLFGPAYFENDPVFTPNPSLSESAQSLLIEIDKEGRKKDSDKLITIFLFSSLLLILARARYKPVKNKSNITKERNMSRFMKLLDQNYTETRDAMDYAVQMHMTYKTLNQLCKQISGKTAKQFIDSYVILEAKRRLVLEKKSIQQLSYELGFDDPSNFVKYFKRHTNESPKSFLKHSDS